MMWPHSQFLANLVTFTDKIVNEKLHFLSSDSFFFFHVFEQTDQCTDTVAKQALDQPMKIIELARTAEISFKQTPFLLQQHNQKILLSLLY